MDVKIKFKCGKCGRDLIHEKEIFSCSHGCIFCNKCTKDMNYICPNCMAKLSKKKKSEK